MMRCTAWCSPPWSPPCRSPSGSVKSSQCPALLAGLAVQPVEVDAGDDPGETVPAVQGRGGGGERQCM